MAEVIKHGSTVVVNSSALVDDASLKNTGVNADDYSSDNTKLISITVDAKGRVTAASESSINVTGVTAGGVDAGGSGTMTHVPNQRIYVSTSSPNSQVTASEGDIWYQTL